jgi:RNA ligase
METPKFEPMPKIGRLSRGCTVTEKIDGTNASIYIGEDGLFLTGSRTRWITPTDDNYGFARWAYAHKDELMALGPGHHFGEWWGKGIQRGYGIEEKRFSLFNVSRWENAPRPACVGVVPKLYEGIFDESAILEALDHLRANGSVAAPGFMQPEGIVVYHQATKTLFKKTLEKDGQPKGKSEE